MAIIVQIYTPCRLRTVKKKTTPAHFGLKQILGLELWTFNLPLFSRDDSSNEIPKPWSKEAREEKCAPAGYFSVLLWIYQFLVLSVDLKMKADKQPVYLWRLLIITEGNTAQSGASGGFSHTGPSWAFLL